VAEQSPGFVWRLKDESGDATAIRPFGESMLVNMSVWSDVAALHRYVFETVHVEILRRCRLWIDRNDADSCHGRRTRSLMPSRRTLIAALVALTAWPAYALYDPAPAGPLARLQGEWRGELTYDDFSNPGKLVTLPTRVFAALASPTAVTLLYEFDDGPTKTVYSYEQMRFDFAGLRVVWVSGAEQPEESSYRMVSSDVDGARWRIVFESTDGEPDRAVYTLETDGAVLTFRKEELDAAGAKRLRNEYRLRRVPPSTLVREPAARRG